MKKKQWILVALATTLLGACEKKDKHDEVHHHAPSITIHEPSKTHYHLHDTAFVHVVISDEEEMHEAEAWFITHPEQDTLWSIERHAHSRSITFNSYFVLEDIADEQVINFVVKGENAEGKITTKTHTFDVHDH